MGLQLFNTLGRKKQEFIPLEDGKVKIYSCGPTVYNYVHLGNLRAYVFVDILKRFLKWKHFKVTHVMNITDVDDKTIRDSKKEGKSLTEFTEFYTEAFLKDMKTLNMDMPDFMPKATDSINEMVDIIKILRDKGYAYEKDGSWYFNVAKMDGYGELACLDVKNLKTNANGRMNDSDEYEKDDARDFALWKAYDADTDGDTFWDTDIGKGRPGWHIECSAMSKMHLSMPFDIHTGGVDLIFPHHTNEIAQSEAAYEGKFVNYWVHNAHLIVNGEKMSKSLGNFFTLKDLLEKGYDPKAIRYELMSTNYRAQLDFKEDNLKKIPDTLQKFYDFLDKLDEVEKPESTAEVKAKIEDVMEKALMDFEKSMDDDLNISGALAAIFEFMTDINKLMTEIDAGDSESIKDTMMSFDLVLGVMKHEKVIIPAEISEKAEMREKARLGKDFATADKIRDELLELGYVIEDTSKGPRVKLV